ncbi:MAG: 50S ribosomal protein L25 [Azospirillum brasilense]|nr:MAG: 50S ribosomal protein L25 [Azospirillum brasilense]
MAIKAAVEFKAEARERVGTGSAREARRQGQTPVNVYAAGEKNQALTVETRLISNEYFRGGFMNKVVALQVAGKNVFAIARDIQLNPVSDKIEHADFIAVNEKSVVKVKVPVHFQNTEKAVGIKRGGVLNIVRHEIDLLAPVTSIPKAIDIDILELNIGDSIHIDNVKLPEGVKPGVKGRNYTIASIAGRSKDDDDAATGAPAAGAVPASTAKAPADAKK